MRIDAYNAISQTYQSGKLAKPVKTAASGSRDAFEISQTGRNIQAAKSAVQNTPDVREDRIAQIKASMASGTYNVSAEQIAEKMVNSYFDAAI